MLSAIKGWQLEENCTHRPHFVYWQLGVPGPLGSHLIRKSQCSDSADVHIWKLILHCSFKKLIQDKGINEVMKICHLFTHSQYRCHPNTLRTMQKFVPSVVRPSS